MHTILDEENPESGFRILSYGSEAALIFHLAVGFYG
jgi:hypothetical protein